MALSDGDVPEGMPEPQPRASDADAKSDGDEASELEERLAAIKVPKIQRLPDPPEVHYNRPTLGGPAKQGALRDYGASISPAGENKSEQPSHLAAGLIIGITFPMCIVVGAGIGIWIDHRWNPNGTPWGTIIMSLAGIAAGFMNVFRAIGMMDRGKTKK